MINITDENFIPRENKENKNNNGADKKKAAELGLLPGELIAPGNSML